MSRHSRRCPSHLEREVGVRPRIAGRARAPAHPSGGGRRRPSAESPSNAARMLPLARVMSYSPRPSRRMVAASRLIHIDAGQARRRGRSGARSHPSSSTAANAGSRTQASATTTPPRETPNTADAAKIQAPPKDLLGIRVQGGDPTEHEVDVVGEERDDAVEQRCLRIVGSVARPGRKEARVELDQAAIRKARSGGGRWVIDRHDDVACEASSSTWNVLCSRTSHRPWLNTSTGYASCSLATGASRTAWVRMDPVPAKAERGSSMSNASCSNVRGSST